MARMDKKRILNCYGGLRIQNRRSASCAFVSNLLNNLCNLRVSHFFFMSTVHRAKENNHLTSYPWEQPMFTLLSHST
ncbi:hypothetical protein EUGRSUZ_E02601 [Eucalyptus grandis]|uniref:Uncharacterized protein n=2 Tax=Eucalyptus grandis TaxID=71139 RepID=A0ACC3KWZ8_EUCGR|nr:hypothetical protein EUGRSUZ_E02601 [Eucalyptus grandis]